jgi:hypothetical protein
MLDLNKDASKKESQLPGVVCVSRASRERYAVSRLFSDSGYCFQTAK